MKPTHDFDAPRQKKSIDHVFYTDSKGNAVSEEYWKTCPKCKGRCMVHRSFDGTTGIEKCTECEFRLEW